MTQTPSAERQIRGRALSRHLATFGLALLAPTLLFAAILLWQVAAAERTRVEEQARALSRGLATALDREIVGILTTLQALGTSPSLRAGDLASFYDQAADIRRLQGLHISLRDVSGRTLFTTRAPLGSVVPSDGILLDADREALRTRSTAVSDVFVGVVSRRPALQIVTPVPGGAEPAYLLGASLDLDYFGEMLRRERLPEGWVGAVTDRRGTFVARSQEHAAYAGQPISADARANMMGESGSYYGRNKAGVAVLAAYARSPVAGWTVSASVPAEVIAAPLRRYLLTLVGLGAALGAIALALTWLIRRRILGAVGSLREAARAIGRDEAVAPLSTAVSEMDEIGRALAAASATLRDRARERDRAEAALRDLNTDLESRVTLALAEREEAEERLRQAQKMEAVGQLTGGIAHDFNNLLQVVTGSLELLRRRVANGDERVRRLLDNAAEAAHRGAALTARLLAFSRRQALDPKPVDANRLVSGMSELLRRSLGEAIQLETVLAGGLWPVHADPHQLENALLNLAVNARDAMEGSGRLTVETANAHLDERYARGHDGVPAGQYVVVAVTDTGSGMPPEVLSRAFEPFFTTKEVGKGSGLGLSQVYGFVRQSGGHVKIYSEPGRGTTVKVYLPRLHGAVAQAAAEADIVDLPRGQGETVLVVEDEAGVRALTVEALGELGYRVLEANGAAAALGLIDQHPEIALLFTDVVMPEVNGRQLADEARRRRPGLKVLFTTGYSRNAIIHNGVLDAGVQMIGKPFTLEDLAAKVRAIL